MNKEITKEEKAEQEKNLEIAKIFEDHADNPVQLLYTRLIKQALEGHYFTLSHMPVSDSLDKKLQKIENISGRIQELEALLEMPKNYAEYTKNVEKDEK